MADPANHSLDNWMDVMGRDAGKMISDVSANTDITISQARDSRKMHSKHESAVSPQKIALDVLTAFNIDKKILPKIKDVSGYIRRFTEGSTLDQEAQNTRRKALELAQGLHFFHWELEMTDAFTDARHGFDCIVGNPPWEKIKTSMDEFFLPYDPRFKYLKTKKLKDERIKELTKNIEVKNAYEQYKTEIKKRALFYRIYELQGVGDKDLWQLVLERCFKLVSDNGIISMLIPQQLLVNSGSKDMREHLLGKDIMQMYVFENKKGIFPIHPEYRFILLTVSNVDGSDKFPAGFFLHHLSSLNDQTAEKEKFTTISKTNIKNVSPNDLIIPETGMIQINILMKLAKHNKLISGLSGGWDVSFSSGFHKAKDSDLFKDDRKGWPLIEGRNTKQFNHNIFPAEFTVDPNKGIARLENKRVYRNHCRDFYNSFRLTFHEISSPKTTRTVIAAIIPPHRFHSGSIYSIIFSHYNQVDINDEYNRKTAYLSGILNSMTFDFAIRPKIRLHTGSVIMNIPIPNENDFEEEITELAARLTVGTNKFEGFAESLGIDNISLAVSERIEVTAKMDALVAHAYGLDMKEYEFVVNSFKFGEDSGLYERQDLDWTNKKMLNNFNGEIRKRAIKYYDEIATRNMEKNNIE